MSKGELLLSAGDLSAADLLSVEDSLVKHLNFFWEGYIELGRKVDSFTSLYYDVFLSRFRFLDYVLFFYGWLVCWRMKNIRSF